VFSRWEDSGASEAAPDSSPSGRQFPLRLTTRVIAVHPHDPEASTQGLLWHRGRLYESTGLHARSSLRRVELESGEVEEKLDLSPDLFGEGLARVGGELIQLTWQASRALRYDLDTLETTGEFSYEGEGWGLCFDSVHLVRSDGTDELRFHEPRSFAVVRSLAVRFQGEPVRWLNELECAEGWIYANLLNSDEIVRIDPASGQVAARVDASGLLSQGERQRAGVLNGIAYREEEGTFLLTGKLWPKIFEVVFVGAD
jgi:glutamine cyclotransferase